MRKPTMILFAGLLLLAVAGCGAQELPGQEREYVSPIPRDAGSDVIVIQEEPRSIAEQMAGQTGIIEMVITDGGVQPERIATYIGEPVRLHVRNEGKRSHNLVVPRFGVYSRYLAPGEENYIEFIPHQKGAWPYFCEVAEGQPEEGLRGILQVE